jgi:hypothetical protein
MFIEDLVDRLAGQGQYLFQAPIKMVVGDEKIVYSLSSQLTRGLGFTEKQSMLAVRLTKKYKTQLSQEFNLDVTTFLDNPIFKYSIRVVNSSKLIKIVSKEGNKTKIAVYFPYDENLIQQIKNFKKELTEKWQNYGRTVAFVNQISWNEDLRCWTFPLWEDSIDWIGNNLTNPEFSIDDEIKEYISAVNLIKENIENHLPMVLAINGTAEYKNVHPKIPKIETTNLIEGLFIARNYGITAWDEKVEELLEQDCVNPVSRQLLRHPQGKIFVLDSEKYSIADLNEVINYHKLLLVIIPGGSEIENLKFSVNSLTDLGISNENMSVLFRLDNQTGKEFNELIKTYKLNNPLDENTKVIFVSGKIPKTLISFEKPIDVILNLGDNSAHYTQRNLVKNHQLVINYSLRKKIASM